MHTHDVVLIGVLIFIIPVILIKLSDRLREINKNDYYLIPKNSKWAEFALSTDELAETYTAEQLKLMYIALERDYDAGNSGMLVDMTILLRSALAIRRMRDALEETEK